MMLHRHFEGEVKHKPLTKASDLSGKSGEEFVSDTFPPDEDRPKRGRRKKSES